MKNKVQIFYDDEVLEKKNDKYLDTVIKDSVDTAKQNYPKNMDKVKAALKDVYKTLEYRNILLAKELFYKIEDSKDVERLKDKKKDLIINVSDEESNNSNWTFEPLYLTVHEKNGKEGKVLIAFSSLDKTKILDQCGTIKLSLTTLKDIYEKYVLNDEEVLGIMINPMFEDIQIPREVAENIINNGCNEEGFERYFNTIFG